MLLCSALHCTTGRSTLWNLSKAETASRQKPFHAKAWQINCCSNKNDMTYCMSSKSHV
jgi:hypothetical protein